jgi:quercetin dioxygenase-like cupin family protein
MDDLTSELAGAAGGARLRIFRAEEALPLDGERMPSENFTATDIEGAGGLTKVGGGEGAFARLLFADPASGLSLGYVWFKAGFILPRHSHNADCAYYVISGELHLGSETIRAGDGFFVPAGAAYTYVAGPEGVEVLECRNASAFNIRLSGNSAAAWGRMRDAAAAKVEAWRAATPPAAAARMMGATTG